MPPDRQCQIETHEIHHGKGLDCHLSLAVALKTTGDNMILARFQPNFKGEHPGGDQRSPTSFPVPPTSRSNLRLDGYLEYPHVAKALYICTHRCLIGIRTQTLRHSS
ncbi:hypothetical protein TNCV_642191 [Trichonephila clavipes]|nr:hypothetical protein TNCV_642191 [Trichonephila clavipes]